MFHKIEKLLIDFSLLAFPLGLFVGVILIAINNPDTATISAANGASFIAGILFAVSLYVLWYIYFYDKKGL